MMKHEENFEDCNTRKEKRQNESNRAGATSFISEGGLPAILLPHMLKNEACCCGIMKEKGKKDRERHERKKISKKFLRNRRSP